MLIAEKKSECGNFHMVACKIDNEAFLFVNVYGPNEDRPVFYKKLNNSIDEFSVDFIIVAGDLNFVIDPNIDSFAPLTLSS